MGPIRRVLARRRHPAPKPATTTKPPGLLGKDDLQAFWRNPDDPNRPERYLEHVDRSALLLGFIEPYVGRDSTILEIGCNVGRNLAHLHDAGYRRLTGIEINGDALDILRRTFPAMAAASTLVHAAIEDAIRDLADGSMDVVYTMAVLEHIHPDSEWIFDEMIRVARSTIVTIEDEGGVSRHHTPRDYRAVFETRGLRQVAHRTLDRDSGFGTEFQARAFTKVLAGPEPASA